jgi:hypothetical protein
MGGIRIKRRKCGNETGSLRGLKLKEGKNY